MTKYYVLEWLVGNAPKVTDDLNKFSASGWKVHSVVATNGKIVAVLHAEESPIPAADSQT